MIKTFTGWLVDKVSKVKEFVDLGISLEVDATVDYVNEVAIVVMSTRKHMGNFYRPYIDCQQINVTPPNWYQRILGITFKEKVERAHEKLEEKMLRRYEKGKTRENQILEENNQMRVKFFSLVLR